MMIQLIFAMAALLLLGMFIVVFMKYLYVNKHIQEMKYLIDQRLDSVSIKSTNPVPVITRIRE
jgi:cell division protein FtsL